jgi:hypothetical protein
MKATFISWAAILVAASAFAAEQPWQATLRSESRIATSNIFCNVPTVSGMRMHYTVPAKAARILESRPPEELLPFLSRLRAGFTPVTPGIVDQWTSLVRRGLRGTPSAVPSTVSPGTNNLEVFLYSDNPLKHAHDPRKRLTWHMHYLKLTLA